jgi:hypothetical protein
MRNAKALFWLGKIERVQYDYPTLAGIHERSIHAIVHAQLVQSAGGLGDAERQLVDDLIAIFDATLELFDKRADREIRRTVDHLALTVVSRVRVYLAQSTLA